jgi:hypothetical protein
MNPTKPLVFLLPALWFWNLSNAASCRLLMILGFYQKLIDLQNKHIRLLERYNDFTQTYLALAYLRSARGHFHRGELIQTVDKCMMAIYTYKCNRKRAFRLCAKTYKILALNSSDFNSKVFWEKEVLEEKKLLKKYFENDHNL